MVSYGTNQKAALRKLFHEIRNSHPSINIDDPDAVYLLGLTVAGWAVRFRNLAEPFLPRESIARLDMIEAGDIAGNLASTHEARMELESLIPAVDDLLGENSPAVIPIPNSLRVINRTEFNEHIRKVINKIKLEDFSGAISNCYTLTETVQKMLLQEEGADFKEDEGSIKKMHTRVSQLFKLDPSNVTLNHPDYEATQLVKQTLEGLTKIISGLYMIANKAGDRHTRRYKVRSHHAILVANATFSYCGFLIETLEFQNAKREGAACADAMRSIV